MRCIFAIVCMVFLVPVAAANDVAELQGAAAESISNSNFGEAKQHLSAALELEPENAYTNYLAALVRIDSKGDLDAASDFLDTAERAGAQPQAVALQRARILVAKNQLDEALEKIESLAESGYAQYNRLKNQEDLRVLEGDPRYEAALKTIRMARFPCEYDELHRSFDFWLGDWDVYQAGVTAGRNQISSILGGCLVFEEWESASGALGKSFNYYDPGREHWRQIWVSDSGTIIEYTGVARDGGIFYTAETIDPTTKQVTHHRFEFTAHPEGGVRQFWATSPDKDEWTTIWDGHYRKRSADSE